MKQSTTAAADRQTRTLFAQLDQNIPYGLDRHTHYSKMPYNMGDAHARGPNTFEEPKHSPVWAREYSKSPVQQDGRQYLNHSTGIAGRQKSAYKSEAYVKAIKDLQQRICERDAANRDLKSKIDSIKAHYTGRQDFNNKVANLRREIDYKERDIEEHMIHNEAEQLRINELLEEKASIDRELAEKQSLMAQMVDSIKNMKRLILKKDHEMNQLRGVMNQARAQVQRDENELNNCARPLFPFH